ncbi:MAG: ROK family protein, partial [Candidatus Margulisiibacteriota bacterium]
INVIDPDCVVVGGGVANIGEKLLQPTRELLSRQLFKRDIKISLAKQKDRSVLLGAIALAI